MGENIQRREGTLKFEGKTIKIYYPNPKRPDKQKQIQVRGISIPEKYDGEEVEYELEGGSKIHWVKIKSDGKMFERKQYGGSIPHNNFNKSQSFHNKREDSHRKEKTSDKSTNVKVVLRVPEGTQNVIRPFFCITYSEKKKEYTIEIKGNELNPSLVFYKFFPANKDLSSKISGSFYQAFAETYSEKIDEKPLREKTAILRETLADSWEMRDFTLNVQWRMVIGLGTNHPYETSMYLDHIYGVPVIPGSALKGIARAYRIFEISNEIESNKPSKIDKEIEKLKEEETGKAIKKFRSNGFDTLNEKEKVLVVFGNQSFSGVVTFLDAFPDEPPRFKVDIMNPHYPEYYSGDKFPTDWQNPNPITFLTVEKAHYNFSILLKKSKYRDGDCDRLLKYAKESLESALKELGVGAKTAVGYGYFK